MARKNIFQLVEENYNIQTEIVKINNLFENEEYFKGKNTYFDNYSFKKLIESFLFSDWKYRSTCLDTDELFERADAYITGRKNNEEYKIINNLEIMENFIKLYFDKSNDLLSKYKIKYYTEFETVFCDLISTLEKKIGLTKREYKDRIVIYPKNAPLETVIDLTDDEDVQWELIRYERENLSLSEKRKSLAYLATNLYIEEDSKEKDEQIKAIIGKATNVLNNLHIRHNNKTGKWENKILKDIDEDDAIMLCDMVFNEMLTVVLMREHKEYETTYKNFNQKQKQASNKKKSEEIHNG